MLLFGCDNYGGGLVGDDNLDNNGRVLGVAPEAQGASGAAAAPQNATPGTLLL